MVFSLQGNFISEIFSTWLGMLNRSGGTESVNTYSGGTKAITMQLLNKRSMRHILTFHEKYGPSETESR